MKDSVKHRPSDEQAYRFLLLILEELARSPASRPEELTILPGQLAALHSKGQAPPIGDPLSMYRVMYFLRLKGSPKMSEVAKALRVSLTAAKRIADVLVDNGYAERLSDPKDGRLVRLTLTDYGRKYHDVIENFLLQSIRRSLNFLTAEEQSILLILVDKITAANKKEAAHEK
jgi:DNA-binding MarR family transcriptional regulator